MVFAQLNTKTEYSFFSSLVKLEDYLDQAIKLGYQTVGICDQENLHAAYRFIIAAQKKGLQPVVAFETNFLISEQLVPMSFIALNTQGYHNLLKISTRKNYDNQEFFDLLSGVAVVMPFSFYEFAGQIPTKVYFSADMDAMRAGNQDVIAFPTVRYLKEDDAEVLQVLRSIKNEEADPEKEKSELLQKPEVYEAFYQEKYPIALSNLEGLIQGIHYDLHENLHLPVFDTSRKANELLAEQAQNGLKQKGLFESQVYQKRINHELSVIHQMGFDDYFLIVADLLRFARENQIYCGMGRGSSAGSLVAYALGITHLDPVKYDFLFERFLNPERVAMPDIDIDMPDDKRADLLAYMQTRYGKDHVAQVLTFSTFGKRQALRDVGKAFGMSEMEINQLTALIHYWGGTLEQEFEKNQRFRAEILRSDFLQSIYQFAVKIEGLPRQTSLHASAIVLADEPLYHYSALKPSEGLAVTQFDAVDVEAIGLLKIDFLGLNYLSLITKLRERVKNRQGIDIDPLEIDLEDSKTLSLFRDGNTEGIFQYWRPAAKNLLKRLQPEKFEDVAVARAIRNPGSSDFSSEFIARRHGKKKVEIIDPAITDVLAPSYGIMIYQEQVMQVTQKYAGFSLGKADLLRRAISKRKGSAEFEKLRAEFISGAELLGHEASKASEIYDMIVKFAGFGFNRSHAYVYAALAIQLAYFKAHYPDEFYEVYLQNYDRKRILADIQEAGYHFTELDINQMPYHDKVSDRSVHLGLAHIQGFPRDFAYWIIENRPFKDLLDFMKQSPDQWRKQEVIRSLIEIGAFDQFESNRGKLIFNLPNLIDYSTVFQLDLFAKNQLNFSFQDFEDLSANEKYDLERERLDVAISPHPLTGWQEKLADRFLPLSELHHNQFATILVEILRIRTSMDRNNAQMAFVEVSDLRSTRTVVFFADNFAINRHKMSRGQLCLIKGRAELRNDEMQLKASQVIPLEEGVKKLWISTPDSTKNQMIANVLVANPGFCPVIFHDEQKKITVQTKFYVDESEQLLQKLENLAIKAVFR